MTLLALTLTTRLPSWLQVVQSTPALAANEAQKPANLLAAIGPEALFLAPFGLHNNSRLSAQPSSSNIHLD